MRKRISMYVYIEREEAVGARVSIDSGASVIDCHLHGNAPPFRRSFALPSFSRFRLQTLSPTPTRLVRRESAQDNLASLIEAITRLQNIRE